MPAATCIAVSSSFIHGHGPRGVWMYVLPYTAALKPLVYEACDSFKICLCDGQHQEAGPSLLPLSAKIGSIQVRAKIGTTCLVGQARFSADRAIGAVWTLAPASALSPMVKARVFHRRPLFAPIAADKQTLSAS
ncbi:hypothetical protein VTK26DRAFT_4452 [Humicola hyalothermophila]